ncbi:MAG TPA: glycoside hydrolase family 31 protein [Saprospiraceae bacterium]|nr:glycoside hydrolase family 31 protein [Saprospiraceae bacterium]HMQ81341.1 glycoside hydrolase family 31 protein [Saprospiraceae bacterium]
MEKYRFVVALTGKPSMPPLWSFGLWMSRITYFSEEDGRKVAAKLRQNKIPADVLHFDTGWFETDWRCDYEFALPYRLLKLRLSY